MREHEYGIGIATQLSLEAAESATRDALSAEGFGVLTEIDVAATLMEKLGVEHPPYRILGACNPALAQRALDADEHIGLLLPCNVIVYEAKDGTRVEVLDPGVMSRVTGDERIDAIAAEARERLLRALSAVEAG